MKKKIIIAVMCIITALSFVSCKNNDVITASGKKLNTTVKITLYQCGSKKIAKEALALCDYYENIFSRTLSESNLSKLNDEGELQITTKEDRILADMIKSGLKYGKVTDGALDITVEPISSMWRFGNDDEHVPSASDIKDKLEYVDYSKIEVTDNYIRLNGTRLDLGAIAKGYIADRIKDYLVSKDVDSAIISLGGNILCIGHKPDKDIFKVGIQKPFGEGNEVSVALGINDMSVVTSGVYERYFYEDDVFYHHILDPMTGYPSTADLLSVSIIAKDSTICDCLSTGCFVMGQDAAMKLINEMEDVYAIFIDTDYNVFYSDGAEQFASFS